MGEDGRSEGKEGSSLHNGGRRFLGDPGDDLPFAFSILSTVGRRRCRSLRTRSSRVKPDTRCGSHWVSTSNSVMSSKSSVDTVLDVSETTSSHRVRESELIASYDASDRRGESDVVEAERAGKVV